MNLVGASILLVLVHSENIDHVGVSLFSISAYLADFHFVLGLGGVLGLLRR